MVNDFIPKRNKC